MNKSFVVIGLGKFGTSAALELAEAGADVLAIDIDKERVHAIADNVTCAVAVDVCDSEAMSSLGLSNMDGAIIAITNSLEISILATIFAKESGIPYVIAKSRDDVHTKVLEKVGADHIIIPERSSGIRVARHLLTGNVLNFVELSKNIRMLEMNIKPEWIGKTLKELNLRQKEKINVIAIKNGEDFDVNPSPDKPLKDGETVLITVDQKQLNKLF